MPPVKLSKVTFPPPKPAPGAGDPDRDKKPASEVEVSIPTELVNKVWNAVAVVPGMTLEAALTMALQQFLRTLPQDFEREDD
jgi:hypothetical protein